MILLEADKRGWWWVDEMKPAQHMDTVREERLRPDLRAMRKRERGEEKEEQKKMEYYGGLHFNGKSVEIHLNQIVSKSICAI